LPSNLHNMTVEEGTSQPSGLISIHQNQSWMAKIMILRWVMTGWNPEHWNATVCYDTGKESNCAEQVPPLVIKLPWLQWLKSIYLHVINMLSYITMNICLKEMTYIKTPNHSQYCWFGAQNFTRTLVTTINVGRKIKW
jgi:hypothetical protein